MGLSINWYSPIEQHACNHIPLYFTPKREKIKKEDALFPNLLSSSPPFIPSRVRDSPLHSSASVHTECKPRWRCCPPPDSGRVSDKSMCYWRVASPPSPLAALRRRGEKIPRTEHPETGRKGGRGGRREKGGRGERKDHDNVAIGQCVSLFFALLHSDTPLHAIVYRSN